MFFNIEIMNFYWPEPLRLKCLSSVLKRLHQYVRYLRSLVLLHDTTRWLFPSLDGLEI